LPVAVDDITEVNPGTGVTITVLINDSGLEDGGLVVSAVTLPVHGSILVIADNTITYTPEAGYSGTDEFIYKVCDANGDCASAVVSITVAGLNYKPVAVPDVDTTLTNVPVTINVTANDTGLEDSPVTLTAAQAQYGQVTVNADLTLTYTPNKDFSGTDEFTYQICDNNGDCATATVKIVVESNIFVPEGFSPNDDGVNDYFEIPDIAMFDHVGVIIFNRWGNIVFEDPDYKNNWNGKSNKNITGSEILPVGTYFYIITIRDTGRKLNGYIYLNR
jgi:gliding motility-associated-like protein